jgi:hypothetical protein
MRYSDIAATPFEFSFAMAPSLRCAELPGQEERLISPKLGGLPNCPAFDVPLLARTLPSIIGGPGG